MHDQRNGEPDAITTFKNLWLAEAVAPVVERVEGAPLLARREGIPDLSGVLGVYAGVDVQKSSLRLLVVGYGESEESWMLHYEDLHGDPAQDDVWAALDARLAATYAGHPVRCSSVDSRYLPGHVRAFCAARSARWVVAVVGKEGDRPIAAPARSGRFVVGVDEAKATLMSRLKLPPPGPGAIHFPAARWCDDRFFRELTAEAVVRRRVAGAVVERWEVQPGRENHVLDCAVYALHSARLRPPLPANLPPSRSSYAV